MSQKAPLTCVLALLLLNASQASAQSPYVQPAVDLGPNFGSGYSGAETVPGGLAQPGYPANYPGQPLGPPIGGEGQYGGQVIPGPGPHGQWSHQGGCDGRCAFTELHTIEYRPVRRRVMQQQLMERHYSDCYGNITIVHVPVWVASEVVDYVQVHVIRRVPGCSAEIATAYYKQRERNKPRK